MSYENNLRSSTMNFKFHQTRRWYKIYLSFSMVRNVTETDCYNWMNSIILLEINFKCHIYAIVPLRLTETI